MKKVFEKEQFLKTPNVLICGNGIVGKNIHSIFPWADLYDLDDNEKNYYIINGERVDAECYCKRYQFAFICVPTPPKNDTGKCDTSFVEDVLSKVDAEVYIIKSTVPPGTTERLSKEFAKRIIFSPEYQGNTQHANIEYNFVILGGNKLTTAAVAQLYQYAYTAGIKIHFTDSITAELCKYMENSFLATKVVFCNEFYRIAKNLGVQYEELRELFVADPRVNPSHTFVYSEYPYYDSKCFNKDLPALYAEMAERGYAPELLKMIWQRNEDFKK